ncbi:MAG: APC family permease [Streptosporangiaceae bacterium]
MTITAHDEHAGQYQQQLHRGMKGFGSVLIALSAATPAVSVFAIAPVAFAQQGSGAFLSFLLGAVIGIGMAACFAELGAAYPIAGGEYSIGARVLGRFSGFILLILYIVLFVFVPSSIALGGAQYLTVVFPSANPNLVAAIILLVTAGFGILRIRINAIVTGIFLAVELSALVVVSVLGFAHSHNAHFLISPHLFAAGGHSTAASLGTVGAGIAIALFSYNGYNGPILLAEETSGGAKTIAKAVYLTFAVTIVAQLTPITAALLGAPSLSGLTNASNPMSYLLDSLGGHTLTDVISIGIFLAGINAVLGLMLTYSRILYSSARDGAWPGVTSKWIALIHPTFRSPWVATALLGVLGAILTYFSSIAALVTFTGVVIVVDYGLIAIAAIVSRVTQKTLARPHRMPLWPLPAVLGLGGTVYVATTQTVHDLIVVTAILAAGSAYYLLYLVPRRRERWVMLRPPAGGDAIAEPRQTAVKPS